MTEIFELMKRVSILRYATIEEIEVEKSSIENHVFIAITVFCILVVAFYAFFAPFLGGQIWEYALIAAYSPVYEKAVLAHQRKKTISAEKKQKKQQKEEAEKHLKLQDQLDHLKIKT